MTQTEAALDRRRFLQAGILGGALLAADALFARRASAVPRYPPVGPVDANGLQLPQGFSSRIVARSNVVVSGTTYKWHRAPDGGRVFAAPDGWVYVSNSELGSGNGGVGMLRFNQAGAITDARRILGGTNRNCAGGHTPWGTWLSCEEVEDGRVWEVDPLGGSATVAHLAMGRFNHEGAAVDAANRTVYLTEDALSGLFYRYSYGDPQDLSSGVLEAAQVQNGDVTWLPVPDPSAATKPTRKQVPNATRFAGGEGIWLSGGVVNFTTKQDDRVWAYDIESSRLQVVYDWTANPNPVLRGVDNIAVRNNCYIFVCEDLGVLDLPEDPKICVLEPSGEVSVFCRAVGHRQSELTGIAFTPSGNRMYFSSQRGTIGTVGGGITFEVTGPFVG
jgi:secreted PhoX family phosphatase